jgi:hypothetical protein
MNTPYPQSPCLDRPQDHQDTNIHMFNLYVDHWGICGSVLKLVSNSLLLNPAKLL